MPLRRLSLALTLLLGCAHQHDLLVVPKGLVHVTFTGLDEAPLEHISGREAIALHAKVKSEAARTAREDGHVAWFFHAFDSEELIFFVARYEQGPTTGTYHVLTRYEVRRTARVERALGVADEIAEYERGVGPVHAGMSMQEVEAARGKPDKVVPLGPWGAYDYVYPDVCVRILEGRAAHVWPAERCKD